MRSSSLSFGGRGFHYTIGSSGSRTTVGIPGTGLSYTDIHRSHSRVASRHPRIPTPSESWIRNNRVNVTIHTPDRQPGEAPIRPDQLDTIKSITPNFELSKVSGFGEVQADNLIEQLRYQQKEASKTLLKRFYADHGHAIPDAFIDHCYDHPDKPWKQPNQNGHGCLILFGILLLIGWLSSLNTKQAGTSTTPVTPAPPVKPTASEATPKQAASNAFPDSKYWPKEVRISAPVVLSGTVEGGTIRQTAKPGAVLDATLSPDQTTIILRRLDISGTLPIGDTDFMERAKKAAAGE